MNHWIVISIDHSLIAVGAEVKSYNQRGIFIEHRSRALDFVHQSTGSLRGLCVLKETPPDGDLNLIVRFPRLMGKTKVIHEHYALGHPGREAHLRAWREELVHGLGKDYDRADFEEAYQMSCDACIGAQLSRNVSTTPA